MVQRRWLAVRRHASHRSFVWNVSVMLTGTVGGQAISLLMTPVLTRLFSPGAFGVLGVYTSVLMSAGTIACLGLELAIPICLDDADYANLVALCGIVLTTVTAVAGLASWLIPTHTLYAMSLGPLATHRWLLPLGLAMLGGYYLAVAAATRAGSFRAIASTRVSQGISGPSSQIMLGVAGTGTPGLVLGYVIGQASGTLLLLTHLFRCQNTLRRHVAWHRIVAVARRYAEFPLYASWARLLDTAAGMMVFVLFSTLFAPAVVGFMFLAQRVLMRPLAIVSTSLLQVFTGEAGRAISQQPELLRRRFYQVVPRTFVLAAAWILLGNLIAAWVFPAAFGHTWAGAIPYLRAISVAGLLHAVLHPVSTTLQMLERQVTAVLWEIGRLAAVTAAVLLPWHAGFSAVATLWIEAGVDAGCCLVLLALMVAAIEQTRRTAP